jgi:hypothetical protein
VTRSRRTVVALAIVLLGLSLPTGVLAAPPVATEDTVTVDEDSGPTIIDVLANDEDPDADPMAIVSATEPADGAVEIAGDGLTLTYEPGPDFAGTDTFDYTMGSGGEQATTSVSVTVTPVNDEPSADNDSVTVPEDAGPTAVAVLVGDTDIDGDTLAIVSTTSGAKGVVVITGSGSGLTYDPATNLNGGDSFTYTIADGNGETDTATVSVTITPVNDDPVVQDDEATVAEDAGATTIDVLENDSDIDGDTIEVDAVTDGSKGTVEITGGGAGLSYNPDTNATGTDTFTYLVTDDNGGTALANVTVTITDSNDTPEADDDAATVAEDAPATAIPVLAGDVDIDGDILFINSVTPGTRGTVAIIGGGAGLTYQPNANANGADTFTYRVSDGAGGLDLATVSITITPVNDPPVADDEALTVAENAATTTVMVLAGDTDVDGDALAIVAKTNGTKGTVTIAPGGNAVTYKPFTAFSGPDSFTYTISDGNGGTDTGHVAVTITGVNDAPNAVNDGSMKVPEGAGAVALPVLANDSDLDGDVLKITAVTSGKLGTVRITGGGTGLTYDPAPLKKGTDTFSYTVSDGRGGTDSAVVIVTVTPDTAPPAITGLTQSVLQGALGSQVRIRLGWTAADPGSGVKSFQLQRSLDGQAYRTIGPPSAGARTFDWSLTPGRQYRFRIRATDREGNTSTYLTWPTLAPSLHQETSSLAKYTGYWTASKNTKMSAGGGRYTSSSTRRFTFVFTGRNVAWVATKTTSSGRAQVFIDGAYQRTINLDAAATTYRQIVFSKVYPAKSPHTMEIRPLGDGRVDVDAIVVIR